MLEFLHFLAVFYAFSGEDPKGDGHARSARLKVVSSWVTTRDVKHILMTGRHEELEKIL